MTIAEQALAYAARKWGVFPCRAADEVDNETGEIYGAKTPLTTNGLRGATVNTRVIKRLWQDYPGAMIGVPTGAGIGAFVLDVDVKNTDNGTIDGFKTLASYGKELPETLTVTTPRGGRHYYFKHVDGVRNRGALGAGIDIRGEGGFVVAAGSVMADGRSYVADNDNAIADAPQWLLDLILPKPFTPLPYHHTVAGNTQYVNAAVDAECRELAGVPQGGRGEALNRAAFSLGTLVAAGALPRHEAESALMAAAHANGGLAKDGERETWAKIRRGLDSGSKSPRVIPEREATPNERMDFSKLIANSKAAPVEAAPAIESAAVIAEAPRPAIIATPFVYRDTKDLPRREFVYGTHLVRKYVSVTVSPGGIGKTSLSVGEALSMVTGKPLLGTKPVSELRVWLFNAEDPRDEMDRRIMGAARHYNLNAKDVSGLFLDIGREQELIIAYDDKRGVKINQPIVEAVIAAIRANNLDVLIIDPFVSTHSVSENDNGAIDKVVKKWAYIADVTNTAIELIHHVKKVDGREVVTDDARGAIALLAASRSARVLNRMTEEQAKAAGVSPQDRNAHFGVSRGKASMAPLSNNAEWYKLESVGLGNGQGLQRPQDHVGVVTPWVWPDAEAIVSSVGADVLENVKSVLSGRDYRDNQQAAEWAGLAVAKVLGVDADDKGERGKCKRLLDAWIKEGELEKVMLMDAKTRTERAFLKPAGWLK